MLGGAIELGHSLGMRVVVEGAETEDDVKLLRRHGCDVVQGYFISRPLPAAELDDLLRAQAGVAG